MQTEAQIRKRLSNIREYHDATWASREMAEPAAAELIWVLIGEELHGGVYLDREYEPPSPTADTPDDGGETQPTDPHTSHTNRSQEEL